MSTPATDSFRFGDHRVTVICEAYYDLIFFARYEWCQFLLDHNGWRYLDEACRSFHSDHVDMLTEWAAIELEKLPEEIRHPIDGTVRDMPTLIRFLAAALHWKVAPATALCDRYYELSEPLRDAFPCNSLFGLTDSFFNHRQNRTITIG